MKTVTFCISKTTIICDRNWERRACGGNITFSDLNVLNTLNSIKALKASEIVQYKNKQKTNKQTNKQTNKTTNKQKETTIIKLTTELTLEGSHWNSA